MYPRRIGISHLLTMLLSEGLVPPAVGQSARRTFYNPPAYHPSEMELRSSGEHKRRRDAAEAKRQRKAEKLAHAQAMGGIRGTHATQVIFDDLIVSVDPGVQGVDQTAQTTWARTDAGLVLVEG